MELMFVSVNLYLYLINNRKVMLGDQKEYVPSLMGKSKSIIIDVVSIIISILMFPKFKSWNLILFVI